MVLSTGLRPYIEQAFTAEHVIIDFAGFSGETLHGVVQEPLDKIRTGEIKPDSVTIRMLLPDTTRPMTIPCRVEDLADDPGYRARMHQVTGRHAYAILEAVQELARLGRIKEASTEIRAYQVPPLFKLYLLNGEEAFFGLYPLVEHNIPFPDGSHPMYDLMGKDAVVFRHSKTTRRRRRRPVRRPGPGLVRLHVGPHQLRVPRMTSPGTDAAALGAIIARTRYLLLDFDGPICSIYAGLPAPTVAEKLRKLFPGTSCPKTSANTPDPIEVFTYSATVSDEMAARVEAEMADLEVAAVPTAEPTPYVHEVHRQRPRIRPDRRRRQQQQPPRGQRLPRPPRPQRRHPPGRRPHQPRPRPAQAQPAPDRRSRPRPGRRPRRHGPRRRLLHRHRGSPQRRSRQHRLRQQARQARAHDPAQSRSRNHQHGRPRPMAPRPATVRVTPAIASLK